MAAFIQLEKADYEEIMARHASMAADLASKTDYEIYQLKLHCEIYEWDKKLTPEERRELNLLKRVYGVESARRDAPRINRMLDSMD
jgi:hypothetical protein